MDVVDAFGGLALIPAAAPSFFTLTAPLLQPVPWLPVVALGMLGLYVLGVLRLRMHRRPWPLWRTLCFVGGCLLILAISGTAVEGYGYELLSVFMFQQLTLMMAAPILLVLGSPGRLLLRAAPHSGASRWMLRLALAGLRSRAGRVALHPGLMIPLFLLTFYGLYLSGIADAMLGSWLGHQALEALFLVAGLLFTIPVLSDDPLPARQSHLGRLFDVFSEIPLHAFFGVIVMMAAAPLVPAFGSPPAAWGIDPLEDQKIAGALAWSYGEGPTVIILLVLMSAWRRSEERSNRTRDRVADVELDRYNAYLARLQSHSSLNAASPGSAPLRSDNS